MYPVRLRLGAESDGGGGDGITGTTFRRLVRIQDMGSENIGTEGEFIFLILNITSSGIAVHSSIFHDTVHSVISEGEIIFK